MMKLATVREARLHGPALSVLRWEYFNAGAYMFMMVLLSAALMALCASSSDIGGGGGRAAGLAVASMEPAIVTTVNAHNLGAHLAGVDCRVGLVPFDSQLGLVELLVPALHAADCVMSVVGAAFLLAQGNRGMHGNRREWHAGNALLAGALLWLWGSMLNSCQVYERANSRSCCSPTSRSPSSLAASSFSSLF